MPRVFAVMKSYVEALRLRKMYPWEKKGYVLSIEFTPISAIDKILNIRPDIAILQSGTLHVNSADLISTAIEANPQATVILADFAEEDVRLSKKERMNVAFWENSNDLTRLQLALNHNMSAAAPENGMQSAEQGLNADPLLDGVDPDARIQMLFFYGTFIRHENSFLLFRGGRVSWKARYEEDGILLITDDPIYCCSRSGELPQALTGQISEVLKQQSSVIRVRCVIVSCPVQARFFAEEYSRITQMKQYGYFCETCEIIAWNSAKLRRTEPCYDALGQIMNRLMVAVIIGNQIGVAQCVEELYMDFLAECFMPSVVSHVRQGLTEYYRLLNDVLYGIGGVVLFEENDTFREIEKEADFVSARFTDLIYDSASKHIHKKVAEAISIVLEHHNEVESLDDVAERLGVTKTYLSKVFKEDLDVNFVTFLCRVRVSKAKGLMLRGITSISDISEQVGYADAKYFSRVFKRITGETPSQYLSTVASRNQGEEAI